MPEVTGAQIAASEPAAPASDTGTSQELPVEQPVATDTTETVAETDEQKNERIAKEQAHQSEQRRNKFERRAAELTAEKYAERARADAAERALAEERQRRFAPPPAEDAAPKRESFSDYEDFVAAKASHEALKSAEKLITQKWSEQQAASQEAILQQQANQLRQQFAARQQDFAKSVPDYFEKVNTEEVRVPEATAAILHTMEDAPAVIYAMANHPQIAQRLWNEPPAKQAVLLGQLSALLKGSAQVSKAPEPGRPTGARSGETSTPPADMDGYMKWRAKQRSPNA